MAITVVMLGREHTGFERAMAAAKSELGKGARKGQCLERICLAYLGASEPQSETEVQG